jgi:hypothetical protein
MRTCAYPGCQGEAVVFQRAKPKTWLEWVADLPPEGGEGLCQEHKRYVTIDMEQYRRAGFGRMVMDIQAEEDERVLAELDQIAKEGFG